MEEGRKIIETMRGEEKGRERRGSTGNIEEMWKRKREKMEKEDEEKMIIRPEKKLPRSPQEERMEGGRGDDRIDWIKDLKDELKLEMREGMKEIKEIVKEQGKEIRTEIEKMKKQLKLGEEAWRKEREVMEKRIVELENKVKEWRIEKQEGWKKEEGKKESEGERIKELERKMERKEREEKRRNIVIKGIKGGKDEVEKEIKEIMRELGEEIGKESIRSVRKIGKEMNISIVRLKNMDQKRRVMMRRKYMKGRNIKIEDDLTWIERKIEWRLKEIARLEREKGRRVWVSYGKIQIEGKLWRWDEGMQTIRDNEGKAWEDRGEGQMGGEGKGG